MLKDNVDKWCTAEFPEGPTWAEAKQWFTDHGWMDCREWHPERWGTFRRHEMGWRRQQGGFNLFPLVDFHPGFMTASGLVEIWSLVCEAYICNMGEVPEDSDKRARLRPAAVPGRRRPLPDLPRAYRLAGGEARAVRCRAR